MLSNIDKKPSIKKQEQYNMKVELILFIFLFLPLLAWADLCEKKAFSIRSVGSQVVDVANRFRTRTSNPLKPKRNKAHEASSQITDPNVVGVEPYLLALLRETKLLLNREITQQETEAIEQVNSLKTGNEDTQSSATNIRAKVEILKTAGFSRLEIRKLMESGIVWIRNLSSQEALLKSLKEGKKDIYFRTGYSFLGQASRILKVEMETNKDFTVLAEVLSNYGFITTEKISISKDPTESIMNSHKGIIYSADAQLLFLVAKSRKPKVNREDIKLPPPTREEAKLKEQGFGPAWTKGLDKLNEWVAVHRQLKELKVHPRTTHVPYFADQIETHLGFAKVELDTPTNRQQKKVLAFLNKEAKKAILEERVTYEWWLNFNFQISHLLSGERDISALSLVDLQNTSTHASLIAQFPLRMAIPTIEGKLGIIAFNLAQSEGVYPLGLISSSKQVDGQFKNSREFIRHDIIHTERSLQVTVREPSPGHRLKHKKILELIENLPTKKRKQAELVYFVVTHEPIRSPFFENKPRQETLDKIGSHFTSTLNFRVFPLKMAGLGKEYSDIKSEANQIQYIREHIIEDFMREVYDPIF